MKILRTAILGSNFTGSYKKVYCKRLPFFWELGGCDRQGLQISLLHKVLFGIYVYICSLVQQELFHLSLNRQQFKYLNSQKKFPVIYRSQVWYWRLVSFYLLCCHFLIICLLLFKLDFIFKNMMVFF